MKILMITPGIDPEGDVFGYVHSLITKIASKVDKLSIITLRPTKDVPENIKVIPVHGNSRVSKFLNLNKAIFSALKKEKYDIIYAHMYLEFSLTAFPYSKIFRTPLVAWYEHSSTPFRLKLVTRLVKKIFSASEQGFRLKSEKSVILGQSIDTSFFVPTQKEFNKELISVSRISSSKNLHTIINAVAKLNDKDIKLIIIGSPPDEDGQRYLDELKNLAKSLNLENNINFIGQVSHKDLIDYFNKASIFINTSKTKSLDKSGLEAMSCGLICLASNEAYFPTLDKYKEALICNDNNLSEKLSRVLNLSDDKKAEISKHMRSQIEKLHDNDVLASSLVNEFKKVIL